MGTNYYLHEDTCPMCGRGPEPLHIGKSSSGWCFSLHVIPEEGINSLDDWKARWAKGGEIKDEYGSTIPRKTMLGHITQRRALAEWACKERHPHGYSSWADFHEKNHSQEGPHGLLRHKIGAYCVGHGDGTWDLIPGEFS